MVGLAYNHSTRFDAYHILGKRQLKLAYRERKNPQAKKGVEAQAGGSSLSSDDQRVYLPTCGQEEGSL